LTHVVFAKKKARTKFGKGEKSSFATFGGQKETIGPRKGKRWFDFLKIGGPLPPKEKKKKKKGMGSAYLGKKKTMIGGGSVWKWALCVQLPVLQKILADRSKRRGESKLVLSL